jgi:hypothetical protein
MAAVAMAAVIRAARNDMTLNLPCGDAVFGDVARFVDGSVCAVGVDHIGIVKIRGRVTSSNR